MGVPSSVLALEAGATGVTASVVTRLGTVDARGRRELPQHLPEPGWVEHAPEEIWKACLGAVRDCLGAWAGPKEELAGIGIADQPDTVLLWDRETLGSPRRAIAGPDRRTAQICRRLQKEGHAERVTELTGLRLDPRLSGTKLAWLAENEPRAWALVDEDRYAIGTVDSYLVARMTRGTWHLTDVSHASRTLLFDLETGAWSEELCGVFGVPRAALPDIVPSWGRLATSDPQSFLGLELPIAGIAGDHQAVLFGQTCFDVGDSTRTHGSEAVVLTNTGSSLERSGSGLLPTAAWRAPDATMTYMLRGAAHGDAEAGGAASVESAALGAAFMAGLGTGVWASMQELREIRRIDREPTAEAPADDDAESAPARD